jgi:hypothetical protein
MATVNPDDPTIPSFCEDATLPPGVSAADCYVQQNKFGPGRNLYWSKTPFDAAPTAISVAAKITAGDMIGPIVGEYTYAGADNTTVRNNSRDIVVPGDLAWTVKITDITTASRELARQTQNGGAPGHFFIVDMNDDWHGGQNGICEGAALMHLRNKVPAGETDLQTIEGSIKGRGIFDAKVIVSPVAVVY